MIKKYWPFVVLALALPGLSFAVGEEITDLLKAARTWVDTLIPILVGIALLYFIWSTIKLITTDNSEKREEAKKGMWWGIIALFVWVAYNALVMTDLKDTKPTVSFLTQGQP
jgi:TRAP-type C4-dicarboxylate transport system permease small subunit